MQISKKNTAKFANYSEALLLGKPQLDILSLHFLRPVMAQP